MNDVMDAFLFFLPAGIANMVPVLASKIPGLNRWNTPMDFGRMFRGKRFLGNNKTWRGLTFGTLMGMLTGILVLPHVAFLDHSSFGGWSTAGASTPETALWHAFIGGLMGLGALLGDAAKSFFKRQHGVNPGQSWLPFDQTDYIIGGLLLVYPFTRPARDFILMIFLYYFVLHLVGSYIGYRLGLKDKPI